MTRDEALARLRAKVAAGRPIIGAGPAPACRPSAPRPAAST